jgi:hypothetical protein
MRGLGAALAFASLAALGGSPSAPASSLHASACKVQTITFENDWDIGSASLQVVRTGMWSNSGETVTATETDTMSPLRHRLHYPLALRVAQPGACLPWNWQLGSSNGFADGFERGGVETLSGHWSAAQSDGSTTSGACNAQQSFTTSPHSSPFILNLQPSRLNTAAKRVPARVELQLPYGLGCTDTTAQFDYPAPFAQSILSQPATVATRTLLRHRGFTLSFSGSASHREPWSLYGGTAQFELSWSGKVTFIPTGCTETIITKRTVEQRPVCYPG